MLPVSLLDFDVRNDGNWWANQTAIFIQL